MTPIDLVRLNEMRKRLEKETQDVIKEAGDLIEEVSKDYAQLSSMPKDEAVAAVSQIASDVVLEHVKLPWYIPKWLAERMVHQAIERIISIRQAH